MPSNTSPSASPALTDTPQSDSPRRSRAPADTEDVTALDDLYKDLTRNTWPRYGLRSAS